MDNNRLTQLSHTAIVSHALRILKRTRNVLYYVCGTNRPLIFFDAGFADCLKGKVRDGMDFVVITGPQCYRSRDIEGTDHFRAMLEDRKFDLDLLQGVFLYALERCPTFHFIRSDPTSAEPMASLEAYHAPADVDRLVMDTEWRDISGCLLREVEYCFEQPFQDIKAVEEYDILGEQEDTEDTPERPAFDVVPRSTSIDMSLYAMVTAKANRTVIPESIEAGIRYERDPRCGFEVRLPDQEVRIERSLVTVHEDEHKFAQYPPNCELSPVPAL